MLVLKTQSKNVDVTKNVNDTAGTSQMLSSSTALRVSLEVFTFSSAEVPKQPVPLFCVVKLRNSV